MFKQGDVTVQLRLTENLSSTVVCSQRVTKSNVKHPRPASQRSTLNRINNKQHKFCGSCALSIIIDNNIHTTRLLKEIARLHYNNIITMSPHSSDNEGSSQPGGAANHHKGSTTAGSGSDGGGSSPRGAHRPLLASTKRPLMTHSKDGKLLSEKKLRRLEKNRLSARECRRRKREATENLETQINVLEGENLRLRLQLQVR